MLLMRIEAAGCRVGLGTRAGISRELPMVTPEEIIDMTDLSRDEVAAIAEHEHLSEICAAAALADYLMHQRDGPRTIRRMIREDMRDALRAGHLGHARELYATLRHFVATHPDCRTG